MSKLFFQRNHTNKFKNQPYMIFAISYNCLTCNQKYLKHVETNEKYF